jgi:hypothetical protein
VFCLLIGGTCAQEGIYGEVSLQLWLLRQLRGSVVRLELVTYDVTRASVSSVCRWTAAQSLREQPAHLQSIQRCRLQQTKNSDAIGVSAWRKVLARAGCICAPALQAHSYEKNQQAHCCKQFATDSCSHRYACMPGCAAGALLSVWTIPQQQHGKRCSRMRNAASVVGRTHNLLRNPGAVTLKSCVLSPQQSLPQHLPPFPLHPPQPPALLPGVTPGLARASQFLPSTHWPWHFPCCHGWPVHGVSGVPCRALL